MLTVSIAKLGSSIQDVEVEDGSTVMDALKAAGYSLDSVLSVKRNGSAVSMDSAVANDDVLMVSQEKVKGGTTGETDPVEADSVVRLMFEVEVDQATVAAEKGAKAYLTSQSTFEILKTELHNRGISMDSFVRLEDSEGNTISISENLTDLAEYKIIISDKNYEE